MHGSTWATRFEEALKEKGLDFETMARAQSFRGVGGEIRSTTAKVYPIGIDKVHGRMFSAEAPGPLPLLLSRPFMQELGTVMDIGRGVVSFNAIGVKDLPLVKTKKGHLAVNLLDVNPEQLTDFIAIQQRRRQAGAHRGGHGRLPPIPRLPRGA